MVTEIIRQIFALSEELERQYPGRHFTPDGHMLGSIGEVYAQEVYGLTLYEASHETHDGYDKKGREVQIKITRGDRIALSSEPNYLLILHINQNGSITEVYNGPGKEPWEKSGKMQKNGQRCISFKKLNEIIVSAEDKIEESNPIMRF